MSDQLQASITNEAAILVSISQAGKRLGIGKTTMYKLLREGDLPSCVVGRRRLIAVSDLQRDADHPERVSLSPRDEKDTETFGLSTDAAGFAAAGCRETVRDA